MNDEYTRAVIAETRIQSLQTELNEAKFEKTSDKTLKVKLLNEKAKTPTYAKKGDAGFDLSSVEELTIPARGHKLIKTGLAFGIPTGYEIQVRSRSGLAVKGIQAHFGTIDEGYTGEVGVVLYNHTDDVFIVNIGDRICQAILSKVDRVGEFKVVDELEQTERGQKGFGSTGV